MVAVSPLKVPLIPSVFRMCLRQCMGPVNFIPLSICDDNWSLVLASSMGAQTKAWAMPAIEPA